MPFQTVKIERAAAHTGVLPAYPSEHLLFTVRNGSGKLRIVWYQYGDHGESRSALLLGDTPLLQIQSSGCPTCESLLAAGYGLPEDSAQLRAARAALDRPYAGLEEALERLRPLLGLLPSGVYVLSHSLYYPTDGDGRFFWDVPSDLSPCRATAEYYDTQQYTTLPCFPCFLYPTQGADKYDPRRTGHYRRMLQGGETPAPALAYALWGYVSVLLDGHHRACACALEGARLPCLTISRPVCFRREGVPHILWPDGSGAPVDKLLPPAQRALLNRPIGEPLPGPVPESGPAVRFQRQWEPDYLQAARRYPTCYDAGALALYPGIALNAEGIRRLAVDGDLSCAARLLRYAARQPGVDPKSLGMAFLGQDCPAELRQAAFELLDQIKDDPEIDALMIRVLVDCERRDDPIYRIADNHWAAP